mmetsp:Transcript_10352/g.17773  ORF Transcript_10352/g.17773 Transcript_10352/m.17773 type:complete len:321 (-) Transcript_10352:214-1176(-)
MGQTQCAPGAVGCQARRDRMFEAVDDEEVQSITDDPYVLAKAVKQSWKKIPYKGPEPSGDGMMQVPVTFEQMFKFNAGVMTNPGGPDMTFVEVVLPYEVFGKLVDNVQDAQRLKENCAGVMQKIIEKGATFEGLELFKKIMLASLRSLLPAEWSAQHELAWNWFWEKVTKHVKLPNMTTSLVRSSWGKLGKEPVKVEGTLPEEMLAQIPTTFKDMATFNNKVLAGPNPERPDLSWAPVLLSSSLDGLIEKMDDEASLQKECVDFAGKLKAFGATAAHVKECKVLILCSLRALMPQSWDDKTETAWSGFWDNVTVKTTASL